MTNDPRDLEILVAKIQKQLAPEAEVLHDVKLDGRKSKTKRQVDVLVREKIGQYEIQIIIDCKDYARRVDVKGVEAFSGLLSDVGAQKGVLVAPKGFTETAKTLPTRSPRSVPRSGRIPADRVPRLSLKFPPFPRLFHYAFHDTS